MAEKRLRKNLPVKRFASRSAWEIWLAKHHDTSAGIWLELAKKDSGLKSVTRPEALEVALCCSDLPLAGRGASGR